MKMSKVVSSIAVAAVISTGVSVIAPTDSFALGARNVIKIKPQKGTHLGTVYINLYNTAPLTAVINRAGKDIENIKVKVLGKPNGGVDIDYEVSRGTLLNHDGIPVFGMYANYNNKVEVSYTFNGKKFKDMYQIHTAPIVGIVRDGRTINFPETKVKKVAKGFEDRLYFVNNTVTGIHTPINWIDGSGAAAWND